MSSEICVNLHYKGKKENILKILIKAARSAVFVLSQNRQLHLEYICEVVATYV